MAVDGHHRARLEGVEHTLGMVFRRVAEVEVHPQPRGGFRLGGQLI